MVQKHITMRDYCLCICYFSTCIIIIPYVFLHVVKLSIVLHHRKQSCKIIDCVFLLGMLKMDRQERLYHIDDTPTGVSDVFREGDKLYEVRMSS